MATKLINLKISEKKILPLVLSKKYSINIDSYFDYEIAKLYYEKKNN